MLIPDQAKLHLGAPHQSNELQPGGYPLDRQPGPRDFHAPLPIAVNEMRSPSIMPSEMGASPERTYKIAKLVVREICLTARGARRNQHEGDAPDRQSGGDSLGEGRYRPDDHYQGR